VHKIPKDCQRWVLIMKKNTRRIRLSMLLVTMLSSYVQFTWAAPVASTTLPSNGVVTTGNASVSTGGNVMTITQSSQNAILNWDSFNIGSAAAVRFVDPNSSSWTLNRVLSASPSQIYGSLSSNGTVFLVNPQGIVVAPGAQVNVGGLVATSLNISDSDFLARHLNFTGTGVAGAVSNAGTITVSQDGFAALIGGQVSNTGAISAHLGSVVLASGNDVTLGVDDSGLLSVGVSQAALNALVSNAGAIIADGGRIIMTAKSANDVLSTVVNNSGLLQADSIGERNGQIWMLASDPLVNNGTTGAAANLGSVQNAAGGVVSTGSIDVGSSTATPAGQVTMAGTTVDLAGDIKASNSTGSAGRVLINSTQSTTVEATAQVDLQSGAAAGSAVIWTDQGTTAFHGVVFGQGVGDAGHGARVEISSGQGVMVDGSVNLSAQTTVNAGSLLLDPATLEIASGAGGQSCTGPSCVTQNFLQSASGNIVLNADGQVTVDALSGNVLNLVNASSFALTSNNTAGIQFLNNGSGDPSGISTNNAAVTLTASGNGSLFNVGQITTHGGNINLSGISVQLGAGLDASSAGNSGANGGTVGLAVFGGAILGSTTGVVSGSQVTLDATYGYIGLASTPVKTNTMTLDVMTGGNAFVTDQSAINVLSLYSNHLMGSPVNIQLTAPDIVLTGQDVTGNGSLYDSSVKWVSYSATSNGAVDGPSTVNLTQDSNLLPAAIVLPGTDLTLTSSNADILGGNSTALTAQNLVLRSPYAIGGINSSGNVDSYINGTSPSDGLALAIKVSGTVDAQVLNTTGAVSNGSIISLSQTGNLLGDADATYVNLNASSNIGSSASPFVINFSGAPGGDGNYHSIIVGGQSVWLDANYSGSWWTGNNLVFDNVQAVAGSLNLSITDVLGNYGNADVLVQSASANGALNISGYHLGHYGYTGLQVNSAASNNSIHISSIDSQGSIYVQDAQLNGTDSVGRTINISNDGGDIHVGIISTNGSITAAAASPLGTVNISAPDGAVINDAYGEYGVLRAGVANVTASKGIQFENEYVDTATQLNLTVVGSGNITFQGYGIDSVSDPFGHQAHNMQVHNVLSNTGSYGYYSVNIANGNGGLNIGRVQASAPGQIYLDTTNGAIVANGSSGGIINAAYGASSGGSVTLSSTGSNSGLGVYNGLALKLSAEDMYLTTSGNMNVFDGQTHLGSVTVNLDYANNNLANYYSLLAGSSVTPNVNLNSINFIASTSGAASGGASANVLTLAGSSLNNNVYSFTFNGDGNLQVGGLSSAAQNAEFNANNISVGSLQSSSSALNVSAGSFALTASEALIIGNMAADNANLYLTAQNGNLTLNSLSSAINPNQASQYAQVTIQTDNGNVLIDSLKTSGASVSLAEAGGNITIGNLQDATINSHVGTVVVNAHGGNILGVNNDNLIAANSVELNNTVGNIGASAVALNIAAASQLTVNNQPASAGQGGGGSVYLNTANDPANLTLDLANNLSGSSIFAITPESGSNPNGLTLVGSSNAGGIVLSNIGVAGTAPTSQVANIEIVADAPQITINSGVNGTQTLAPISYSLTPGVNFYSGVDNSNAQTTINLSGSNGKLVTLNLNNGSSANDISGQLGITDFLINASSSSGASSTPVNVDFTLESALHNFTLNRSGDASSNDSYQLVDGAATGQSLSAVSSNGQMLVSGSNDGSHALNLTLEVSGEPLEVGNLNYGASDSLTLSATTITGSVSNQLTAGGVSLVADGGYNSMIGSGSQAVNVAAGNLSLTTQGSFYVNVDNSSAAPSLTLSALDISVSHPASGGSEPSYQSSYQIGGDVSLTANDVAESLNTTLDLSAGNLHFSFTTDRNLIVGDAESVGISDVGGSVSLASSGNYSSWQDYTPIGIEQYSGGSGITAGSVSLVATGYLGHVGTGSDALLVNTPALSINTNGSFNVVDSAALQNLSLTLSNGRDHNSNFTSKSYALSDGGDLSFSLIDNNTCDCTSVPNGSSLQLANLTSSTLRNFSLDLADGSMPLVLGNWNGSSFAGQINLSAANSVVSLTSASAIYLEGAGYAGSSSLNDSPSSALSSSQAVVVANTLNLAASSQIAYSSYIGWYTNLQNSIPVEVSNLSLFSGSNAYVANIGSLNVTGAQAASNIALQAVASGGAASIGATGVIASPSVTLTANYGNLGSASQAITTTTQEMNLQGGGDMYVSNQSLLSQLSIISLHNKSVTNSGTTNTLVISDNILSGGGALQLGVTDQALGGGLYQYQMNGLNEPDLEFSFTSDAGLSLGNLLASTIALRSYNGNIYEMSGDAGITTAGSVSMIVDTAGDSIGASGHPVRISSSDISFTTGYNLYVRDGSVIDSLGLQTYWIDSGAPVYSIDNSAAPAASRLTFNVTGNGTNNVLNINDISMATPSGNTQDALYVGSYSNIAINTISVPGSEGQVTIGTNAGSINGLSAASGIVANQVTLGIGDWAASGNSIGSQSLPVVVDTASLTLNEYVNDNIYINFVAHPTNPLVGVSINQTSVISSNVISINDGSVFSLNGGNNGNGSFSLLSATSESTNLSYNTNSDFNIGTLNMGGSNLSLTSNYGSISADGGSSTHPNIATTGSVNLYASGDLGHDGSTTI